MWDVLWKVHPEGLKPRELCEAAGLQGHQVRAGAKYLRDTFSEEPDPPVVYVRSMNTWFIAPTWAEHTRQAVRAEYLQQAGTRLETAEKLLAQAKRAFPNKARQIGKVLRNVKYTREEIEDLLAVL